MKIGPCHSITFLKINSKLSNEFIMQVVSSPTTLHMHRLVQLHAMSEK